MTAKERTESMSKICMNPVCSRIQETDGCVSADWCPYYFGTARLVTSDATIPLPEDQCIYDNRTELRKD